MVECAEKVIEVGFSRDPKLVFDEVELVSARMIRDGWKLVDSIIEDGLGNIHLMFEKDFNIEERKKG